MVTPAAPTTEVPEAENPIVTELAQMDATGDDKDILAEIATLNAQEEAGTESTTLVAETPAEVTPQAAAPAEPPVAEVAAPVIQPPVAPAISPELQQYITKLEQQNQLAQQQNEAKVLEDVTAQYAQRLAQEAAAELGVDPSQVLPFVQKVAKQQGQILYQQYQTERMRQGQINAAFDIGKEMGVDPRTLMNLASPEAMREAAKQATAQNKTNTELAALRVQVAALTKKIVPPQRMDNGQGAPVANVNESALLDAYNMGDRSPQAVAAGRRAAGF